MTQRQSLPRAPLAAALALAALAGACGTSGSSTSTSAPPTQSTPPTTSSAPPSTAPTGPLPSTGVYADGATGTPHYTLDVTTASGATISGSLAFVFQDGRTQTEWTFTGSAHDGTASLTTSTGGRTISATYTTNSIVLASCTSYLQYAQNSDQCTFTRSATGT